MNKKAYTPKEVCHLANISARQLSYWKLIGIVRPGQDLRGSRTFNRYSERDLELLKAVQKLTEQGYLVSKAADRIKAALASGEAISAEALINLLGRPPLAPLDAPPAVSAGLDVFQKRLEAEMVRSRRFKYMLSCLAIRIDVSPADNDEVMRQVMQKAEKSFNAYKRAYDMIAQVGRNECLWLLCQTTPEKAWLVAERIPQMFPDREWFSGPVKYSIRIQVGSGTIEPAVQDRPDLVSRARAALPGSS